MKTNSLCCLVLGLVLVIGGAALAADHVDIGDPTSEAAHNAVGWGPSEPGATGGNFGGIATWPGTCAVIWHPNDDNPLAEVDMAFSGVSEIVSFKHLDGPADDSFDVYVEGVKVWSYADSGISGEHWYVNGFTHDPGTAGSYTVAFVATGQKWGSFSTYGQVAFSGVWIGGGPVPAEKSSWGNVKSLYR